MKRATIWAAALALLIGLAGIANGMVYDDQHAIVANPLVHAPGNLVGIWTSPYWPLGLLYRPLTIQLFAFEWAIGQGAAFPFHAMNALLYVLVTILVVRLARRMLPRSGALAAGLVFAVHPVHVEAVANGVGQSELLATLLVLLALDRFLAWRASPKGLSAGRRVLIAACYALAIAAKETGYVLPLLLVAVALVLPTDRPSSGERRRFGALLVWLGGVGAAALLVRIILFGGLAGEIPQVPLRGLGLLDRTIAMLAVVPVWARLLLWPVHLQAHYGPPALPVTTVLTAWHLLGLSLALGTLWLIGWSARRAPILGLGLAWMVIGLAPVSNVPTPTGILLAERTLFLPSVGFALVIGWGWTRMLDRWPSRSALRVAIAGLGILIVGLAAARSIERTRVWKDEDTFFSRLERDAPDTYRAQLVSGTYYAQHQRHRDAERAYRKAWTLYREDPAVFEALGQLYRIQKRCGEALPILNEGVLRHPEATVLRARTIECDLAVGDTAAAISVARQAVDAGQPEFESTLKRLARAQPERKRSLP